MRPSPRTLRAFYASAEWRHVRALALARYGANCRACGTRPQTPEVDHILPVRLFWPARLSINNLQVLCRACHAAKHRTRR